MEAYSEGRKGYHSERHEATGYAGAVNPCATTTEAHFTGRKGYQAERHEVNRSKPARFKKAADSNARVNGRIMQDLERLRNLVDEKSAADIEKSVDRYKQLASQQQREILRQARLLEMRQPLRH